MSCPVPAVVARQSFTSQTAAIASTTVYTPTSDTTLRVSGCLQISGTGTNHVQLNVQWTDDNASQQNGIAACFQGTNGATGLGTQTLRAKGGQPVQINTTVSPSAVSSYDAFVVVEDLGS